MLEHSDKTKNSLRMTWGWMNAFGVGIGALFPIFSANFFGTEAFGFWYGFGCLSAGLLVGNLCFLLFRRFYQKHTLEDIEMRRQLEQSEFRLRKIAFHDYLTGLPSRSGFYEGLSEALAKASRHEHSIALLFLDLDRFKKINDTLGHNVGDEVLKEIGRRLQRVEVPSVKVARFGGDEFVVLVNPAEDRIVRCLANEICATIREPVKVGHFEFYVQTSIGVSRYPQDGTTADSLIKHADIAMYRAKDQGGNQFALFSDEMGQQAQEMLQLEGLLHRALELNELSVVYQPQYDLKQQRIVGVEALLRWYQADRGWIGPDRFIPVAEETGLILPIGVWVLETACRQMVKWHQNDPALTLSVNVSARQLSNGNFARTVGQILKKTGLAANSLTLEITESLLVEDNWQAVEMVTRLRERGVGIALDDFGTGYSSLNYLHRLPITSLKIDRSNVVAAEHDAGSAAILQSLIDLAKRLSLQVVAEGVETCQQRYRLQRYECHLIQGFWYSRPLRPDQFEKLLRAEFPRRLEGSCSLAIAMDMAI